MEKGIKAIDVPDKTKPFVRRVRKAAGLKEDGRATEGNAIGMFGLFYS